MVSLLGDFYLTVLRQLYHQFGGILKLHDFDKANRLLADVDWEHLLDTLDVNQALQSWENVFKTTMETCIPKESPLAIKELKTCNAKNGNTLFQRAKSSGSTEIWRKYKGMLNKETSILRNSKQSLTLETKNCVWKLMENNEAL